MTEPQDVSSGEQSWLDALIGDSENGPVGACVDCKGQGYVREVGGVRKCHCSRDTMYAGFYETAGIPHAYYGMSVTAHWNVRQDAHGENLTTLNMTQKERVGQFMQKYEKALPAICAGIPFILNHSRYERSKIKSLRLTGGPDSGKTFLAASVSMQAVRQGLSTRFYEFFDLIERLRDFENRDDQALIVEAFRTMDLIVIDNVNQTRNEYAQVSNQLERIARQRLGSGKVTIITSPTEFTNESFGSGWRSLIASCFEIKLPSPKRSS